MYTKQMTILLIEDETRIADWIERYFLKEGFSVHIANSGKSGLVAAEKYLPSLIVLDLNLPDIDGFEVCRSLRKKANIPIIMLTARDSLTDRVNGLDIGADDYMIKPFDPEELIARVYAVLRRASQHSSEVEHIGDFRVMNDEQRIFLLDREIPLTAQQYTILYTFLSHPNRVLSRDQIIDLALNDFNGFDRAIDTHIKRIRSLIEKDNRHPKYIHTIYGAGYKLTPEKL